MAFQRGDIVSTPFPYNYLRERKLDRRLVVSSAVYQQIRPTFVVALFSL